MADTTSKDLFNKLRGKFGNLTLGKADGQQTLMPQEAVFFEFDYTNQGQKLGSVVVSLVDEGALKVYFNNDIVTEQDADATQGFYDFLTGLKHFATANMLNYEAKNISKTRLDKKDYEYLANQNKTEEELAMESRLYGSKQKSYQDLNGAKLIVQHTRTVDEERHGARSRNIKAIYIENGQGERFRFENNYLPGARAMARHISNGGYQNDQYGEHISEIMAEMSQLKDFVRGVKRNDYVNEDAQDIIEKATGRYYGLKSTLESISKQKGYTDYFENYSPDAVEVSDDDINDIKSKLTRSVFDDRLEGSLSAVGKAMKLQEKKSGDYYDMDDFIAAAKKNGAEIQRDEDDKGTITLTATVAGKEIGSFTQDKQDREGQKVASRFKNPGYGELNMDDSDRGDAPGREFTVPSDLKLIPGEMPKFTARDNKAVLQMILVDIASRAVDDEVSIFAADMAEKIGSQGGPFGQVDTPEFKGQKKQAIELAKMYLAQHKKAEESIDMKAQEVTGVSSRDYFAEYEDSMSELIGEKKGKDHDGDGDIDSDDYMAARDKAIKKSMGKKVGEATSSDASAMSDEAHELVLFGENDGDLYRQRTTPIVKNLARKMAKGVYDSELAKKLWMYWATDAAKRYAQQHSVGTDWNRIFNTSVRREVAAYMEDYWKGELELGNTIDEGMDEGCGKPHRKMREDETQVDEGKMRDIDQHVEEMIQDGASDEEIMAMHPGVVTQEYLDQKRMESDEKYYDDMEPMESVEQAQEGTDELDWIKRMSGIGSTARSNHGLREGEPGYRITPRSIVAREMRKLQDIESK